jgi:hypothetical protein
MASFSHFDHTESDWHYQQFGPKPDPSNNDLRHEGLDGSSCAYSKELRNLVGDKNRRSKA